MDLRGKFEKWNWDTEKWFAKWNWDMNLKTDEFEKWNWI